jgi:hypothetical protein
MVVFVVVLVMVMMMMVMMMFFGLPIIFLIFFSTLKPF